MNINSKVLREERRNPVWEHLRLPREESEGVTGRQERVILAFNPSQENCIGSDMPFVTCADSLSLQGFQLFMYEVVMVLRTAWYRKLDTRIAGKSMSMVCVHAYMCVLLLRVLQRPPLLTHLSSSGRARVCLLPCLSHRGLWLHFRVDLRLPRLKSF